MAYFSSVEDIRFESGFVWNSDISDDEIESYEREAHWSILSILAAKYDISNLDTSNPNFDQSPAHHALAMIERLRASWNLLIAEYGADGTEKKENGEIKIQEAKDALWAFFWDSASRLIWNNWSEFTTVPSSWGGAIASTGMTNISNWMTHDTQF